MNVFYLFYFYLLKSSSTEFVVVLFFIAFYTAPFSSEHFFLGLFVRSLSTQLFFLVVLLLLLLNMTAFSYVGLLSLFWVRLFHTLYLRHLPPSSFLEELIVSWAVCRARIRSLVSFFSSACSLAFLSSVSPFLRICRAMFINSFGGVALIPLSLSWLCWFQLSEGSFFLFFSGIFHASSTVLFFFLVLFFLAGLYCLPRMHALTSRVGDTWQRPWRDDFTHNGKQVVNRLKIP